VSPLRTRTQGHGGRAERSDPELVRAVGEGDAVALGALYDRYAVDVWRAVRRALVGAPDAEDVVHAIFVKLPQIAPGYDGRASCRAWLCGIAVRFALRHRRGAGRFRRMLGLFADAIPMASATSDPERQTGQREELALFERALARLSAKKRAVFVLVELEGLSSDEAAAALEIPAATVRTRLFHARTEIHAAMSRGGSA
jgi:RNA polymerase sigma-70 factor (ECF subfamily)